MRRALLSLMLVLTACTGSWSDEDLLYASALPKRGSLRVTIPTGEGAPITAAEDFNLLINTFFAFAEQARLSNPTSHAGDERVWGPYYDDADANREIQLAMQRVDEGRFDWHVESRPPAGEWLRIITASSQQAQRAGTLTAPVATFRDVVEVGDALGQLDQIDIDWSADSVTITTQGNSRFAASYVVARLANGVTSLTVDEVTTCWNTTNAVIGCE